MSKLSNFSLEFYGRHPLGKSSLLIALAAFALSAGIGTGIIYLHDRNYSLVYSCIAGSAIINGIFAWLLSEIFDDRSRKINIAKIEAAELKIKFEREIYQAKERIDLALIDKCRAESVALAARIELAEITLRLDAATQAILAAQINADIARSKTAEIDRKLAETIQEKLKAEENARLAQARVDEIAHRLAETIQEKLKAEEDARLAQAKVAETDREKLKAEEDIRLAQAKATEISHRLAAKIQEKLKAEEDARFAQAKVVETVQRLVATTQEKNEAQTVALFAQAEVTEIAQKLAATTQAKDEAQRNVDLAQVDAAETARRLDTVIQEKLEAEKNIKDLCQSIDSEFTSYEILQRENIELKLIISELEKLEIDDNNIDENTSIQCLTVCDALMFARQNFTILNIWNNAFTTAATIDRYLPKKVYAVLEILANVGNLHFQGSSSNGIPELLRQRGVPCSRESVTTMGKYGHERDFPCSGKKPQRMEMHLKVGRKIRIYFDIDSQNQQIIIGYCGQHLHTATG
jgi:hypothetical protein